MLMWHGDAPTTGAAEGAGRTGSESQCGAGPTCLTSEMLQMLLKPFWKWGLDGAAQRAW